MRRPLLVLSAAVLALAFGVAAAPNSAAAAAPITTTSIGAGANAGFFAVVDGVETSVFVSASDFSFSDPGGVFEGSDVFVDIFQFDPGNPRNPRDDRFRSFSGYVELTADQFQPVGDLDSAALVAVVNVCEFAGKVGGPGAGPPPQPNCFDVAVDASWTGTGDVQTFSGRSQSRFDGCRVRSTFTNSFRSAVATGSVSDGATNFTPNPSDFADLNSFSSRDTLSGDCLFPEPPLALRP